MIALLSIGLPALILLAATVTVGRRDLTHPGVAFAIPWFAFALFSQLRLTDFEQVWSPQFAILVLLGGSLFVAATFVTTGLEPTRGTIVAVRTDYVGGRFVIASGALLVGALAGTAWKASILGGVPLVSGDIDVLRSRAYGPGGEILVPAWSTFLTNGFHLGLWCLLAAAWCGWAATWRRRGILIGGVSLAVLGALSGGSRNALLFALAVPVVAAYQLKARLSRGALAVFATVAAVGLILVSVVFLVRVNQREAGRETFLRRELTSVPLPVRVVMPIYIGGAFPFEAERRLAEAENARYSPLLGAATLQGLPDAFFRKGKAPFGEMVSTLTYTTTTESPYWTVATYQGRALADLGVAGAVIVSVLLGLLFGAVYRTCRRRRGLLPLAAVGYCAYYSAFLVYDNLLSLAMMAVAYDLLVLALTDAAARRRVGALRPATA